MRSIPFKIFIILLFVVSAGITGCNQKPKTPDHLKETVDMSSKEYASAYICPMHCEGSGSAEMGQCPVCKMDYVKNKDYQKEDAGDNEAETDSIEPGGSVDEVQEQAASGLEYACPMHPEITGKEGETCGTCGMDLVALGDDVTDHTGH